MLIRTNFRKDEKNNQKNSDPEEGKKDLTKEEFEEFMIKSGAGGSFMVFRSNKKDDEMGIDKL